MSYSLKDQMDTALLELRKYNRYNLPHAQPDWICGCVEHSVPKPKCLQCGGTGHGVLLNAVPVVPEAPCPHEPGTAGKLSWLCQRYSKGLELWNDKDERFGSDSDNEDYGFGSERPEFFRNFGLNTGAWRSHRKAIGED